MTCSPLGDFANTIFLAKYAHTKPSGHKESWEECAERVAWSVCGPYLPTTTIVKICDLIKARKLMPGGRFLYAAGRSYHPVNNCYLLRCYDTKEGWADLTRRAILCLMSGGGIGVDYDPVREEGALVKGLGGYCTGPLSPMQMINEAGRHIKQGGSRRSAIWARLRWKHKDIRKFINMKDWPGWLAERKREDFNVPAPMDCTNISVGLDDDFFAAMSDPSHSDHRWADDVYWDTVRHMVETAEPGFSVDCGINTNETLRNACTELTSEDDNDICDLASLVLSRFSDIDEFEEAIDPSIAFLLCGTLYSDIPYLEVGQTREKNRRLGLGLMGFHEWLLVRGKRYGPDEELGQWLTRYATSTEKAHAWCDRLSISRSVKTRAIAPNGTIGIVAETTTSIEPVLAVSYLRRYLSGSTWKAQYVIDAAADRLIVKGVDPDSIEDAYELAEDVERRVSFQSWVQGYVDHAISSTINMPPFGSSINNEDTVKTFGKMLLKYLPTVRGMTCYPDGARGGQPLTKVSYHEAIKHSGKEFETDSEDVRTMIVVEEVGNSQSCLNGVCGL